LVSRLQQDNHDLRLVVRRPDIATARWPGIEIFKIDFAGAVEASTWDESLEGIHAVINAVGIITESRGHRFESLHVATPIALFSAATRLGVERVIQISALGADTEAASAYHLSKYKADESLLALHHHAAIVQPSLVFGSAGASARQFVRWAALPIIPVPDKGRLQPIHIDDLCDCVAKLLLIPRMPQRIAAVGPRCLTVREYLEALRLSLGAGRARMISIPMTIVRIVARIIGSMPNPPLDRHRLAMLERGNCANAGPISALLGKAPRPASGFIPPVQAPALLRSANIELGLVTLRASVAVVWFASGIVSLGLWPVEDSLALLARCGLTGETALIALYGAAALDIGFGAGTLLLSGRFLKRLYETQAMLVVGYTLAIGLFLPEFLLHPFAPIVKNLPILAALILLHRSERP
jgi:uncharacterized protein YbjT (DUF2867 family)